MEDERRKAVRVQKHLLVSYSKDKGSWDITVIRDFSESGMQITAAGSIGEQEMLYLRLRIPFAPFDPLEIRGQVVGVADLTTRFGAPLVDMRVIRILFVDVTQEQKTALHSYIQWFVDRDNKKK